MRKKYVGLWFVLPGFTGLFVFYLLPFLDVIRRSFYSAVGNRWAGVSNYASVLGNDAFRLAVRNTGRFLVVCIPLLLVFSLLTALGIAALGRLGGERLSSAAKSACLMPMAIPAASVVLLWQVVFHRSGLLNGVMSTWLGRDWGVDWMHTEAAFGVLVFCYLWKNLGYDVVLWIAGLGTVPTEICEAARMDGAGRVTMFFCVVLPCMRSAVLMIVIVSLLNAFKVFREAWMVAGNYPQEDIYLLQHLFNNWFRALAVDKMAAGAVLLAGALLIPVLLLGSDRRGKGE